MTQTSDVHPYDALSPDKVLDAVESLGFQCDGRLLALNSYENRVYRIGLEDRGFIVAKFYRPNRWSDQAIEEEHQFTLSLAAAEIPVIAPFRDAQGKSLHCFDAFRFAVYPNCGGRWPELDQPENLIWLGRLIGRIHALGQVQNFRYRSTIDVASYGWESLRYLTENNVIPEELRTPYNNIAQTVLRQVEEKFAALQALNLQRIHADCHPGNILWTEQGPHFVDFDDTRMGSVVQDLWMLLSGDRREMTEQLDCVLEGYTEFNEFDAGQLLLIESLRTLRMLHYSAWLARRWSDPAFPLHFPWFIGGRYWEEQILALKEQSSLIEEPPLVWR